MSLILYLYQLEYVAQSTHFHLTTDTRTALQWARNSGRLEREDVPLAARNGYFEVFQWARNDGCAWDGGTCAAMNGHLEVLQLARNNGCAWDEQHENGHGVSFRDVRLSDWIHLELSRPYGRVSLRTRIVLTNVITRL